MATLYAQQNFKSEGTNYKEGDEYDGDRAKALKEGGYVGKKRPATGRIRGDEGPQGENVERDEPQDEFADMDYGDLQERAKEAGIKANQSADILKHELRQAEKQKDMEDEVDEQKAQNDEGDDGDENDKNDESDDNEDEDESDDEDETPETEDDSDQVPDDLGEDL